MLARRKLLIMGRHEIHDAQADLAEIIPALTPPGGFSGGLNRRQQQRDQDADDRDDNKQLDERKSAATHADLAAAIGLTGRIETLARRRTRCVPYFAI
jgi:hypothetical protein